MLHSQQGAREEALGGLSGVICVGSLLQYSKAWLLYYPFVMQPSPRIVIYSLRGDVLSSILRTEDMYYDYPTWRFIMVRDPICGIALDVNQSLRVTYHDKIYHFCSHDCRVNFEDRPEEYVQPTQIPLTDIIHDPIEVLVNAIRAGETTR
jgi:YHS domain-containing protein